MSDWFLAYTKPKCEDSVSYKLETAGFEVLNPKIKERKYYRRKLSDIVSPLFPCYLFVKFDKLRDYHLIRYTRGLKWLLGNEAGPSEVPQQIIDSIAVRLEGGIITVRPAFSPGDIVYMKGGAFEGIEAVFEREMNGIERVSILLKAINIRVVVDGRLLAHC